MLYFNLDETGFSHGGGGGFTQTRIEVTPGETLLIQVGSGGKYNPLDLRSEQLLGFQRGGAGGISSMGRYAGSGGGYSAVFKSSGSLVAMAGGGGGGGATDTCCSHGGAGSGGSNGLDGFSPGSNMPYVNDVIEKESSSKLHSSYASCSLGADGCVASYSFEEGSTGFLCYAGKGGENLISHDDEISGTTAQRIGIQGLDGSNAGGGGGSGFTRGTGGGGGHGTFETFFYHF